MKAVIMFLLLSGVVMGQADTSKSYLSSGVLCNISSPIQFSTTLHIGGTSFFIKDGRLEITYNKDIKPSESVEQFFEWVKEYVKGEYYLIKRKELDKLIK